jgi:hypothetical protein
MRVTLPNATLDSMERTGGAQGWVDYQPMQRVDQPFVSTTAGVAVPDLLSVADAGAARQALAAARAVTLLDGRRTALWIAVRIATVGAVALWLHAVLADNDVYLPYYITGIAFFLAVGIAEDRFPVWWGARPALLGRSWPPRVGLFAAYVGTVYVVIQLGERSLADAIRVVVALGSVWALMPLLTRRRRRHPAADWPPGSEAFALLSVLDRAWWVEPQRLGTLTELPPVIRDQWLDTIRSRGWVTGGRERRWGSPSRVEITSAGREQLRAWRRRLGARGSSRV